MYKVFYQPPNNTWMGDIMPYGEKGTFYLYHQRDPRDPGPLTESTPFGWALSTTDNFINYEDHGISISSGGPDDVAQWIYAGSVFKAGDKIHAFYTGYNKKADQAGKTSQVLLHAISDDYEHFIKNVDELALPAQPGYDVTDWRDPWVIWDEENSQYLLILGTRLAGPKSKLTGRIVSFTSKDLKKWDFQGDFFAPNLYTGLEMPDIFKIGDWWYLLYTEYSDQSKTRYRMSKNMTGPWIKPKDDSFDGRAYYAARSAYDGNRRVLFGWVPTRERGQGDLVNWEWGGTYVPLEIVQRSNGTLGTKLPDELTEAFKNSTQISPITIENSEGRSEKIIATNVGDHYVLDFDVNLDVNLADIAIRAFKNQETDESYQYLLSVDDQRLTFDKSPEWPWYQMMTKGLERPLPIKGGQPIHVKMIVDDDILVIVVENVSLISRVYHKFGNDLAIAVSNGEAKFSNIILRT
ncbi:glycosyl hydrolase family 32 [Xylocopilactobacillus apicola]|uniref:beta-fructofuranosidase n=1 Tax=Xylocopilactobacillus apicola TaxID=2932184 RepID=A0AAU9D6Y8_9LACO|nr:glycosyl hydrolase family 32 [Xylocopilactobacillus apicola]BDR58070.1 beta-fructofuranosidase [Xylocopilactobacillus apicola]